MFIIKMTYEYISIISSILAAVGYMPEIYNLSYSVFYKTIYKAHSSKAIWFIWISSSTLSLIYGVIIKDYYIATYGGINAFLNISVFLLHNLKEYQNMNNIDSNIDNL
jgi:hypothetical protein